MEVFEVVIALLVGGAALAAVARRIGAPSRRAPLDSSTAARKRARMSSSSRKAPALYREARPAWLRGPRRYEPKRSMR